MQSAAVAAQPEPAPVLRQLAQMMAGPRNPFLQQPAAGYCRGIDFYSASSLVRVLGAAGAGFRKAQGRWPNILDPQSFSDKIFWSKFFRPMKVPETGNKLKTDAFIPGEVRSIISCPEIVWHSRTPKVPRSGEVEPGDYYLKASHGSDMFRRVTYPITEQQAEQLDAEFARFLRRRFGLGDGEWWYNSFAPELMLEKAIGTEANTVSWDYFTFGEQIPLLAAYQKTPRGPLKIYLTPDFKPLPNQTEHLLEFVEPSEGTKKIMADVARAIGKAFGFVRVDFLLDDAGKPYLGEVTFSPGNALTRRPAEQEEALGRLWNLDGDIRPRAVAA